MPQPDLKTLVRDTLAKTHYDVVQVEFIQMGQHVPRDVPLFRILTEHEIQFANSWNAARTEPHCAAKIGKFYEWLSQFNYEIRMCRRFDRIVCMTEQDRSLLSSFIPPAKLRWIPIGVDSDYFRPQILPTRNKPNSPVVICWQLSASTQSGGGLVFCSKDSAAAAIACVQCRIFASQAPTQLYLIDL